MVCGSTALSDIYEELENVSKESVVDDKSFIEKIQAEFEKWWYQELPNVPIVGDFVEAWNLFKWLKVEKKAFNNIKWTKAYKVSPFREVSKFGTWLDTVYDGRPDALYENEVEFEGDPWEFGFHFFEDGTCSYLSLPLDPAVDYESGKLSGQAYALGVNEAIDLTAEYLPSWIEIYSTYVATGDLKIANDLYDFYTDKNKYQIHVTVYQLLTVTEDKRGDEETKTVYQEKYDNGEWKEISKETYDARVSEAEDSGGVWSWLKDKLAVFTSAVQQIIEDVTNLVKGLLGLYYSVQSDYVGVVTKGYAYDYIINQQYTIGVEQSQTERMPADPSDVYFKDSSSVESDYSKTESVKVELGDGKYRYDRKTVTGKHYLRTIVYAYYMRDITVWSDKLEYVSSSIEQYDEKEEFNANTRYEWIVQQVIEQNDLDYTLDDVAAAAEVSNAYMSQKYGLLGGATVKPFVLAGDMNESIVKFASQFEEKNLAYMMAVDDTNTFWAGHWCAMFVTYCMRKAGIADEKIAPFWGCSNFWNENKSKPGFYDIKTSCGATNGGYVTSDPNHLATYNDIQPGDILLFRWRGEESQYARSHTGLALSVERDAAGNLISITTIEGNTGGGASGYSSSKVNTYVCTTAAGSRLYNIVSFVSISEVLAEYDKGNKW